MREIGAGKREPAVDQVADVESRVAADRAPDGYWQVEEQCLNEEDHRHPLVVRDHSLVTLRRPRRDLVGKWHVVGVSYPAEAVCVLLVAAGEVRRHPAVDRLADVLLRRDDDREDDEDRRGVEVRQAVGEVVVALNDQARKTADHRHDPVHLCRLASPDVRPRGGFTARIYSKGSITAWWLQSLVIANTPANTEFVALVISFVRQYHDLACVYFKTKMYIDIRNFSE